MWFGQKFSKKSRKSSQSAELRRNVPKLENNYYAGKFNYRKMGTFWDTSRVSNSVGQLGWDAGRSDEHMTWTTLTGNIPTGK